MNSMLCSNNTETFSTLKQQILWRNFKKLSRSCLMFHIWQLANMLLSIEPSGNWGFGALELRATGTLPQHVHLTWKILSFGVNVF